ncbi:MAG: glycosyltransferase family 2 protein [Gammaproteobacteria bacterium]|nr:glycosyltransferase family 2 protein [Gammaproteobacteria bacterium]
MNLDKHPLVSIILINYNGAADTIECVESLTKVTYANVKIIIVDNASTDNSIKVLKHNLQYENVIIIESPENNGFSAGNNIGIQEARKLNADYMLILNNDTLVEPDFIEPLLEVFDSNEDVGCVISKILYASDPDKIWYAGGTFNPWFCRADHDHYNLTDNKVAEVKPVEFASGCCMLLSREAIDKTGLMDEDYFLYVEDTEYSLRLRQVGFKLMYTSRSVIYHKVSATTSVGSDLSQYYTIRNTLYLSKVYSSFLQKLTTMTYNVAFYTHKVLTGQYKIKNIVSAQVDYHSGVMGRSKRF